MISIRLNRMMLPADTTIADTYLRFDAEWEIPHQTLIDGYFSIVQKVNGTIVKCIVFKHEAIISVAWDDK